MKNKKQIQRMVGIASLAAIVVVLQLISNYITFGPFNITLALTPLIVGAIIYGPWAGAILGVIMGGIILTAPSTGGYLNVNPIVTVILCLLKTGVAGFVAGVVFRLISKKNYNVAIVVSSVITPIVNTAIFAIGSIIFFMPTLREWANGENVIAYLFLTMIGINFVVEFIINSALAPTVNYIVKIISKNYNVGSQVDL